MNVDDDADCVRYAVSESVATITFNRPDALNAIDSAGKAALLGALRSAAEDDAVRAVVLTGTGRGFCVGQDLKELESIYAAGGDLESVVDGFNQAALALAAITKPTIAAINGPAAGGGASLAFACDFRLMADTASFSLAFAAIGLVPDTGMSWMLPRLVGIAKAQELLTFSGAINASDAERLGLVTRVVPADHLPNAAAAWARELATGPSRAYALTKRALVFGQTASYADALVLEAELQVEACRTQDHRNALTAFLRKEKPVFEGR
jgi:2-(1,2-epoxy-1,2-dihydrophenyl)acetyl-CoA isomerase